MPIFSDIKKTIDYFKNRLRIDESFDLLNRTIKINGKTTCMFFVDGLLKDEIMEKIMEYFYSISDDEALKSAENFGKLGIPYVEVNREFDDDKICTGILSGMLALFVEGFDSAFLIDVRTYPQRDTGEPSKDKVLRGSHDGFVETLVCNTALIRRRIRNTNLTMKYCSVGSYSKTDVALCYLDDKVDKNLLNKILNKINNIKVEALTMNQQSLVEAIYHYKWYNPFPKAKFTERPDTCASAVLKGNIAILVDNSPSVILIPTSIFDILEEADDFYFPPFTGTYLRLSRYFISFMTLILTPMWLLSVQNPHWVPDAFKFTLPKETINIPIFWQIFILELIIDGLRLASLHTPTSISTTLSIVGGIILSDFAVESGWFNTETMLYMAFVAVSTYSQPSLELGYALKFFRLSLLILTSFFNLWGFSLGFIVILIFLTLNKTISGKSYLYPLIPFNRKAFVNKVIRVRAKP